MKTTNLFNLVSASFLAVPVPTYKEFSLQGK
jgi:hypothetical protein